MEHNRNIKIEDALWKAVRKAAIDEDVEVKQWVAQALKEKLEKEATVESGARR